MGRAIGTLEKFATLNRRSQVHNLAHCQQLFDDTQMI
jgi:hypothetical protein